MAWYDFIRLFTYNSRKDPISRKEDAELQGAGITQPDVPDIRAGMGSDQYKPLNISVDGSDFIDLSTITNRLNRYKEYDRLQNVAEVENALTTFADEACVAGHTPVITPFGAFTIKDLAETKKSDERFLVYCWDFEKHDYTLGWAYNPRKVKQAETVEIRFEDGTRLTVTPDHQCLRADGQWVEAGDIQEEDEFIAFHRVPANQTFTKAKINQFPRIYTRTDGWKHERQFIDEWKSGKKIKKFEMINTASKFIHSGLNLNQTAEVMGTWRESLSKKFKSLGFTYKEIQWLCRRFTGKRRVIGVSKSAVQDVYDLSVEKHKNFATDTIIVHNCQEDEDGHVFKVKCSNDAVREEVEFLLHDVLEMDDRLWTDAKTLYKMGDLFWEIVISPDSPKDGILKVQRLPVDSMFRIETIRGRLIEFQQSKQGPDYNALTRIDPLRASKAEMEQGTAIRFHPDQIIHMKIGDERKTFYPYGVSMIEAARGPAHLLQLMEDAMLVYRLVRAPERRVFYIDVANLSPARAEAFMDRIKDQYRKKKVFNRRSPNPGSSAVDERYVPPSAEEDFWIPMRPNSSTRIDTLPGAQNLGEIDDAIYFRQKLYTALQFPRNYLQSNDPQATKLTLSQQDTRFARMIERLQKPLCKGLREVAVRHLKFIGWPEEDFHDLKIKITPPSDWRRINRNEVDEVKFNRAATMKGSQLMSDYDIFIEIMEYDEHEAKEMVARIKAQKLDDLKMQMIAQDPRLLGFNTPEQMGTPMGTAPGGPNPQLNPDGSPQQPQPPAGPESPEESPEQQQQNLQPGQQEKVQAVANLPEPTEEEVKRYALEIKGHKKDFDDEEVDTGDVE